MTVAEIFRQLREWSEQFGQRTCGCPRNVKCSRNMRAVAYSESRALRALHVMHGRIPTRMAPTDWGAPA